MNTDKLENLNSDLVNAQKDLNDRKAIEILEQIITIHSENDSFEKVIENINNILPLLDLHKKQDKKAKLLLMKSLSFFRIADYKETISVAEEALKYYLRSRKHLKAASCYSVIGGAYRNLGKYGESLIYLLKSVDIYSRNEKLLEKSTHKDDKIKFAETYQFISNIYHHLNQRLKSREYTFKALEIFQNMNYSRGIAANLINIGVSYSKENPEKTLTFYKQALKISKKINDHRMNALNISNIGGVYEDMGKYEKALHYYFEALEYSEKHNVFKYKPFFLEFIGSSLYKEKKFDQAIEYLSKSIKIFKEQNVLDEIKNNYKLLSKIYEEKKEFETALEFHKKVYEIDKKLINKEMISKISSLEKKHEKSTISILRLKRKNSLISDVLQKKIEMDLVGKSEKLKKVLKIALRASIFPDTNVLLSGESGTGKEIIANIIHYNSLRKDEPMIAINSSSIPESLVESEFFGFEKGSFTGAKENKIGYLELANKGTLFLDEIVDMPISLQAKLLRVLEYKRIKRIGSKEEIKVDFRIISATNKNIYDLVEKEHFRMDLLYRLNTIEIEIPPLRERMEDVEILLEFFVRKYSLAFNKKIPKIDRKVIQKLKKYSFPGNIRELKNMIEKALIMLDGDILRPEHFSIASENILPDIFSDIEKPKTISEMEQKMIKETLLKTGNNMTKAAHILDISYSTLKRKITKFQIRV